MPLFKSHETCTNCAMHATCKSPGIGGRKIHTGKTLGPQPGILVVGESPGYNEDNNGTIFIGKSGKLLVNGYIKKELGEDYDVYATNAVKCAKPFKGKIKVTNIKACSGWLREDIEQMFSLYPEVIILCVGQVAATAVLKVGSLKDACRKQGVTIPALPWGDPLPKPVKVFSTFHPAFLLRSPKKTHTAVVKDHMKLVKNSLLGMTGQRKSTRIDRVPNLSDILYDKLKIPAGYPSFVSVDIETVGILAGVEQRGRSPHAVAALDGKPIGQQIVSVAVAMDYIFHHNTICGSAALWDGSSAETLDLIIRWANRFAIPILFTNALYDLSFLASVGITVPRNVHDVCVYMFAENPDRPESGLKDGTKVLLDDDGTPRMKYGEGFRQYHLPREADELLDYNFSDVVNPILIARETISRMRAAGVDYIKIMNHYRKVIAVLHEQTMAGVKLDRPGLLTGLKTLEHDTKAIEDASAKIGFPLRGKGSGKAAGTLFADIAEGAPDQSWSLTETTGKVSTSEGNMRTAVSLNLDPDTRQKIEALRAYKTASKLLTTYFRPLEETTRNSNGFVFPQWFPVPSRFDNNEGSFSESGGTRQARVTCKRPALQTSPAPIKKLFRSRWLGGQLWSFDYNQLELRMAAFLSNDRNMTAVYMSNPPRDLHHETLCYMLQRDVDRNEHDYDHLRRVAKFRNFGILYGITPSGLCDILWRKAGIRMPEDESARWINSFRSQFTGLMKWQSSLVDEVRRNGKLVLPLTGQWLSFTLPTGEDAEFDKAILNFPVQGEAANVCLNSQYEMLPMMGPYLTMPMNVYDAVYIDAHPDRVFNPESVRRAMTSNWYLTSLFTHYGRSFRFTVDAKRLS